ncbi:MAG: FHA domain-containing protein [Ktedonobacteraceae bacterium]
MQLSQSLSQSFLQYQGRYYPLNKPRIVIGSDQSCDIRIENNPQVLPMHVQVISQAGQVFLQYMERGAAIWVNGSPVSQQVLQDQDEIAVGDRNTRLKLQLNRNPAGADQQAAWANTTLSASTRTVQNGPTTNLQAAQNAGGTQGLDPLQQLPPAWSAASPGQMPPTRAATPSFGTAQPLGAFAAPPQQQVPMPAMGGKVTDTTRYLCAAGHLDEDFQDYAMRHVIYEEHRALGESYGVDMPAVVSWCKSGLRRINVRDGILTGLLALVVFGYFLVINLVVRFITNVTSSTSSYGSYSYSSNSSSTSLITTLFGSSITIILALIVLIIALNIEKWIKRRWPNSHPGIISYVILLIPFNFFGFIVVPLIWLTIFIELIVRYYGEPTKHLRKDTFNPQARPVPLDYNLERKLQESFSTGHRNVVAYSGYKPFAGAGYYKRNWSWSFVIDTSKGAYDTSNLSSTPTRKTPLPFTVSSLYNAIEKDVWALSVKNVLEIASKLYVHGQYLPENPLFFNAAAMRPVTSVDPSLVEQYKEHPTEDVRYYQCLRFNFWRGEMILTAFLRFVRRGKDLFVEIDYALLPPMDPDYYWVDERELTPSLSKIWQIYKRSLDAPIQIWLGAPFRLLRGYFYTWQQRRLTRVALNNPAFDYGASTSLREFASDDRYHLLFQELDEEMYLKVVEKQILETIFNFLEAHQIDTTELRQRQQMILNNHTTNNSTINNSGTVNNSGMMGNVTGGQVNNNSPQPPQQ